MFPIFSPAELAPVWLKINGFDIAFLLGAVERGPGAKGLEGKKGSRLPFCLDVGAEQFHEDGRPRKTIRSCKEVSGIS